MYCKDQWNKINPNKKKKLNHRPIKTASKDPRATYMCRECNVHLCINNGICWERYHEEKLSIT